MHGFANARFSYLLVPVTDGSLTHTKIMQRKSTVKRLQHSPLSAVARRLLVRKAGVTSVNDGCELLESFVSDVKVQYGEALSTETCSHAAGEWAVVSRYVRY